jgi:glycosyltransferase involved in cell wall biosynthesis
MLLRLAEALREAGEEPIVASMRPGWMTERAEAAGLPVWVVPQKRGLDPAWLPRFARRLRREGIDMVHTHEFAMNAYGGLAARMAGVASVATIHGKHWVADRRRRILAYRALRAAGVELVAVSQDLARYLEARLALARGDIHVVYNGIPMPERVVCGERRRSAAGARAELGIPADGPLLVAVGNLYPVKDHATLIRAMTKLGEPARLAIAGRGEEEQSLRALAAQLGFGERLHLLGLRDDVDRLLTAADLFVQPSVSEGLPLSVLEAMAVGLPIVATRVGGMPEALGDDAGMLVPPGEPSALASAIDQLLANPGRADRLGQAARTRAVELFSLEAMVRQYLALYGPDRGCIRDAETTRA